jgi:hypothetical protein
MGVCFTVAGACPIFISYSSSFIESTSYTEACLSQLNLSFSTHIQKLRFCGIIFGSRHTLSSTMPSMLARTTSPYIYEIEFWYCLANENHFLSELENDAKSTTPGSSMWTALDTVLSRYSNLRITRFRPSLFQPDPLPFIGYVKRGLSSCNARGLLSFEHAIDCMSESGPEP